MVITGLGPDFTRMESFGKVEAFADTLVCSFSNVISACAWLLICFACTLLCSYHKSSQQVSGLDRSWRRPPGVAAKLIDCKASKGICIFFSIQ